MATNDLQGLLERPGKIAVLSTADRQGAPNAAIFGSVQMRDQQIIIGCSNNRSLKNLQENPKAALLIVIPGENLLAYQGQRLYLKCAQIEDSGSLLEEIKTSVAAEAGRAAARMIQRSVTFEILEQRDLVDMSSLMASEVSRP